MISRFSYKIFTFFGSHSSTQACFAITDSSYVSTQKGAGRFQLFASGKVADVIKGKLFGGAGKLL